MSYTIEVRICQTDPTHFFNVVEQTVWNYANGGTWGKKNDAYVLTMGGSGTSGCIRMTCGEERVIFAFGVHNYKRWCDVVTGLASDATGVIINPQYYDPTNHADRCQARERQLAEYSVKSATGRNYTIKYNTGDGNNLVATIVIG